MPRGASANFRSSVNSRRRMVRLTRNLVVLEPGYPAEVPVDVNQGRGILESRRGDPVIVFSQALTAARHLPIQGSGPIGNRLVQGNLPEPSQEDSERFFVG